MRKTIILFAAALLLAACKDASQKGNDHANRSRTVIEEMSDIDRMVNLEEIVADSSLMDADGDVSWHPINEKMIRIRNGNRYYLRLIKENETVTHVTYSYDNGNGNNKK